MRYVIIRCEDNVLPSPSVVSLLDGAKTRQLQQLAQAGAAGALHPPQQKHRIDRLRLHQGLLGLEGRAGTPGSWYAASANIDLEEGEAAWCCDLVTQRDGKIIDPVAGRITTKESEVLLHALDEQFGSDTRRWEVGEGSHHVLVVRDPHLSGERDPSILSPDLLIDEAWEAHLPQTSTGDALRLLIGETSKLLEEHPINRVRVDLGENPANLLWLWGPATRESTNPRGPAERNGMLISKYFPMRGVARARGFDWKAGPASLEERPLHGLMKTITTALEHHRDLYLHVRIETADPVERLCEMERLDQLILKPLVQHLPREGPWRLLTVIDDRGTGAVPFVAIGTGLPQQPVTALDGAQLAASPLVFQDAAALGAWFRSLDSTPSYDRGSSLGIRQGA